MHRGDKHLSDAFPVFQIYSLLYSLVAYGIVQLSKKGAYKLSLVLELGSCDKVSNREAVIIKFSWFWLELTGWGERLTLDTAFNTAKFDSISTMCFSKLTG